MTTVTIEFPQTIAKEIEKRGVSSENLQKLIVDLVENHLNKTKQSPPEAKIWSDGSEFASRMIANNRELFEELSRCDQPLEL